MDPVVGAEVDDPGARPPGRRHRALCRHVRQAAENHVGPGQVRIFGPHEDVFAQEGRHGEDVAETLTRRVLRGEPGDLCRRMAREDLQQFQPRIARRPDDADLDHRLFSPGAAGNRQHEKANNKKPAHGPGAHPGLGAGLPSSVVDVRLARSCGPGLSRSHKDTTTREAKAESQCNSERFDMLRAMGDSQSHTPSGGWRTLFSRPGV